MTASSLSNEPIDDETETFKRALRSSIVFSCANLSLERLETVARICSNYAEYERLDCKFNGDK